MSRERQPLKPQGYQLNGKHIRIRRTMRELAHTIHECLLRHRNWLQLLR